MEKENIQITIESKIKILKIQKVAAFDVENYLMVGVYNHEIDTLEWVLTLFD